MKKYKHPNGRIVDRDKRGRFTKTYLECVICPKCGSIILPDDRDADGVHYPEKCHDCGWILNDEDLK